MFSKNSINKNFKKLHAALSFNLKEEVHFYYMAMLLKHFSLNDLFNLYLYYRKIFEKYSPNKN